MTLFSGTTPPTRNAVSVTSGSTPSASYTFASRTFTGWTSGMPIYAIIGIASSTVTISSVSSSNGGSWSRVAQKTQGSMRQEVWVNTTATSDTGTLTVNLSGSAVIAVSVRVYGKADTSSAQVSIVQTSAASATYTSPTPVISEDNAIVDMVAHINAIGGSTISVNAGVQPETLVTSIGNRNSAVAIGAYGGSTIGEVSIWTTSETGSNNSSNASLTATLSTSKDYITTALVIRGARVSMTDYSYQYTDSGLLLNNQTGSPIYDIEKVTGLSDINIDAQSADYDGAHGGYTYAKYLSVKTVVLEGTLYANSFTESMVAALRGNFAPQGTDKAFHIAQDSLRYIMWAKPIGFKCDIDQARARGVAPFQIQLSASDPRWYSENKYQQIATGNTVNITVGGTMPTAPRIWFYNSSIDLAAGAPTTYTFARGSDTITITRPSVAGLFVLDLAARTLEDFQGSDYTGLITGRGWWVLEPGINTITLNRPGGAAGGEPFSLYYAEANV